MKITRHQLRRLINEAINEITVAGKDEPVKVKNGNFVIGNKEFSVKAKAGAMTGWQYIDVSLTEIEELTDGSLQVSGKAMGTTVNELVPREKVEEIKAGVISTESSFIVKSEKEDGPTFKFSRLT